MKLKYILAPLFFLLVWMIAPTAHAQINYSNIKVDELTDTQIRQWIQRAEAIGYTDQQLEQLAMAQGMKATEVQKLKLRVEKLRKQGPETPSNPSKTSPILKSASSDNDRNRAYTERKDTLNQRPKRQEQLQQTDEDQLQLIKEVFESLQPKIYGAELFKNSEITFEPNLRMATPVNYIIGPDDELIVDLTGTNEQEYKLKVSPDGFIRMEYVGLIAVGGLTIEQARSKIKAAMGSIYPALRTGGTQVAVNIGNIRSIKVIITGSAVKPGTYTLPSLATVFTALYAAGGPNENGSFRQIQLIRNNKLLSTVDIYQFLQKGIQQGNFRLQDQDVIHIPVYQNRVELVGEVKIPALFELLPSESLQQLLVFGGGFTTEAYQAKIKVLQNTDRERKIKDIDQDQYPQYQARNGDKFLVEGILDRFENRVTIKGAVFRPGQFELEAGLTLKGLIQKADGLTEDAFQHRGYINRLNPDLSPALLSFDVAQVMKGAVADIALQREDEVIITSIFDMREEYKVSIQGEVRFPGLFDYSKEMHLQDLIQMAGGFKEGATPSRVEVSRRVKNSDANSASARTAEIFMLDVDQQLTLAGEQFILEPFDIVSVRSAEGYTVQRQVKLEGEVLYPGVYTIHRKDERISDIIARAGGLTIGAYPEGASLKRPGAEKANPKARNAIDNAEEEERNLLNLERLKKDSYKDKEDPKLKTDSLDLLLQQKLVQSDLIGIDLERILARPKAEYDLILEDGDVIRIPKILQTVKVTGEVLNPNGIVFKQGRSLKSYVNGAGGFTANALKRNVYVKYANGTAEAATKVLFFRNYPKVKPGAEIMVPKRAPREPMTTQAWIAVSSALASMAAIVITLFR